MERPRPRRRPDCPRRRVIRWRRYARRTAHPVPCDGRGAVPSVLDEIVAGVREDLIAREAAVPMAQVKAAAAAAASPADALAALRAPGVAVHRRGQAPQPVEGRAGRDRRPRALAREYEAGGARIDQRADRGAALRRLARRPGRGARRGAGAGAAQGLRASAATRCTRPARTARTWCCSSSPRSSRTRSIGLRERIESLGMTALVEVHTEDEASAGRSTPARA